ELAVIVRPGPYVCAEWENGGLPYWLLKYPNIKQRSSDSNFLRESLAWWDVLLPMIRPYLWQNNGPVIMVQIENEYGSFGCDHVYLHALRDKAVEILGNDTVLFTTDPPETIECGVIDGVYATVDFGERGLLLADEYFKIQADANKKIWNFAFTNQAHHIGIALTELDARIDLINGAHSLHLILEHLRSVILNLDTSEGGPRVDSELYPGWYRTWGEKGIEQNPSASTGTLTRLCSLRFHHSEKSAKVAKQSSLSVSE
ncbi:glycosyl hydrolase family 35, partial [Cooperia oncophora]